MLGSEKNVTEASVLRGSRRDRRALLELFPYVPSYKFGQKTVFISKIIKIFEVPHYTLKKASKLCPATFLKKYLCFGPQKKTILKPIQKKNFDRLTPEPITFERKQKGTIG